MMEFNKKAFLDNFTVNTVFICVYVSGIYTSTPYKNVPLDVLMIVHKKFKFFTATRLCLVFIIEKITYSFVQVKFLT